MNIDTKTTERPEGQTCPKSQHRPARARIELTDPSRDYPAGQIKGLSGSAMTLVEGIIDQAILLLPESDSLDPARDMLLSVLTAAAGRERAQAVADDSDYVVMPSPERQNVLLRDCDLLGMYDGTSEFSRWYEEGNEAEGTV